MSIQFDSNNAFWVALKKRIWRSDAQRRASLLATSILLPLTEGVLVNEWTSNKQGAFLVVLGVVALVHVTLTAIVFSSEATGPDVQLARSVEVPMNSGGRSTSFVGASCHTASYGALSSRSRGRPARSRRRDNATPGGARRASSPGANPSSNRSHRICRRRSVSSTRSGRWKFIWLGSL